MSQTPGKYLLRNYRRRRNIACKCFIIKSGIEFTFSIFHDGKRMFADVSAPKCCQHFFRESFNVLEIFR